MVLLTKLYLCILEKLAVVNKVCCRLQDLPFSEIQQLKLDQKHLQVVSAGSFCPDAVY
jgi:hypothetical protein